MPSASEDFPPPSSAAITLPSADTQAIETMVAAVQQGTNTAVVPLNSVPASTTSQAVRELPAWKKLPPEVRMMIFRKLGRGYFNSKNHTTMPTVMLAFEGVREDYAILWEIFFDLDVYKVKLGTTKTFASMTKKEAQLVKNVRITQPPWNDYDATMTGNVESSRRFCRQFKLGTNIRRVEFAACQDMKGAANAIRLITEFPFWLEGFPALEFLSVEICSPGDIFDTAAEQKLFKGFIKRIAKKVKVVGRRSEDRKYKNFGYIVGFEAPWNEQEILPNEHFEGEWKSREVLGEVREWVWEAGRRQTMNWSQSIGELWTHTASLGIETSLEMQENIKAQDRELKAERDILNSSNESEEEEDDSENESEEASENEEESEIEDASEEANDGNNENEGEGENDGDKEGEGESH